MRPACWTIVAVGNSFANEVAREGYVFVHYRDAGAFVVIKPKRRTAHCNHLEIGEHTTTLRYMYARTSAHRMRLPKKAHAFSRDGFATF